MDRRIYLNALAEIGLGDADTDWGSAPHTEIEHAWENLWRAPLLITVSATGTLSRALTGGSGGGEDASRSAPAPRYRLEQTAYWFFIQLGQDARDQLGVELHDSNDSTGWHFARLRSSIDDANAAARSADIPLRFERKLSAAEEVWERQVKSGKVVGMDDPVWMAKTQEQIDAYLERVRYLKKGE